MSLTLAAMMSTTPYTPGACVRTPEFAVESLYNAGNQLTANANYGYQYDDNENLIRKTLLATGNFTRFTYDAENRLTQVEEFAAGNPTAFATATYRYDGLGRRIEKVANGQTKRYIYDGEDILLEYNGANVLQARYTHGPGIDEPLSRTPMVPGVGSGRTAVLASTPDGLRGPVVDDGIAVNGQVTVGFVLVSGVPTPAIGQPIDSTGSHQPVAPIDVTTAAATGTLAVDLIDSGGIGGNAPLYLVTRDTATNQVIQSTLLFPAVMTFASTTPFGVPLIVASTTVPVTTAVSNGTLFYHQDGLGTVTDLTDSAGVAAKSYSYDAYGNIVDQTSTVDQPYTYTGRELDSETGLYYYRARYYDPSSGRFLQKDPIGFKGGDANLYVYVRQNPVNRFDPLGLATAYCGSGPTRLFVPDTWWGQYSFREACKNHDGCYDRCFVSKSDCDFRFLDDLANECKKLTGFWANDCYITASVYYKTVRKLGDDPFNDAQANCYCPPRSTRAPPVGGFRPPEVF